jgi:hypothetical protein
LCSHSVVFQHFMEPESSLPRSQELSTCTYPRPDQSSPQHPILSLNGPSYKLLTFHVPNLMSIFLRLGCSFKESVCVAFLDEFVFYGEGLLAPHPTSKLEDHPLSFVRGCLFNIFAANPQSWRPSLPSATRGRAMLW